MEQITDIKEVQGLLFDCLMHFKQICEKHGLRYFLSCGTLLGAVRYGDFIPWDDDVDVMMPREDYDRFVQLSDTDNERYKLLEYHKEPGWRYAYAKLTDTTTVAREAHADFGVEVGVSVDIFPIDYRTNWRFTTDLNAYHCGLLKRFLCASIQEEFYSPRKGVKRMILKMIYIYSRAVGAERLRKRILKMVDRSRRGGPKRYSGTIVWNGYNRRDSFKSDLLESTVIMRFHGVDFPAPAGYDAYLTSFYGDYLPEPPVEKRKSNHPVKIFRKQDTRESE